METDEEKPDDTSNYNRGVKMTDEKAIALNESIKRSEEYRTYSQALQRVKANEELYAAMNTFRRRNYELQCYNDGINRYQEIHNLAMEYEKVLRNPDVNAFLMAEQVFSRKLQMLFDSITDGLELDYEYMG